MSERGWKWLYGRIEEFRPENPYDKRKEYTEENLCKIGTKLLVHVADPILCNNGFGIVDICRTLE